MLKRGESKCKTARRAKREKGFKRIRKTRQRGVEWLTNSPNKEEALLQANFIRIKLKQIRHAA